MYILLQMIHPSEKKKRIHRQRLTVESNVMECYYWLFRSVSLDSNMHISVWCLNVILLSIEDKLLFLDLCYSKM